MANYTFTFPAAAAGLAITVTNRAGETVDSGTVGSATDGFAAYVADLNWGDVYEGFAQAANSNVYYRAPGERVDSSGAALSTSTEDVSFEMTTPQSAHGTVIAFDTIPNGYVTTDNLTTGLPVGYYRFDIDVEFTQPAETHAVKLQMLTSTGGNFALPAATIYPDGSSNIASAFRTQIHGTIRDGDGFQLAINETCVDGTVTPADLEVSYVYVSATRIG